MVDKLLQSSLLYIETVPEGPVLLGRPELKRSLLLVYDWAALELGSVNIYLGRRDGLREADEGQSQVHETVFVLLDILLAINDLSGTIKLIPCLPTSFSRLSHLVQLINCEGKRTQ